MRNISEKTKKVLRKSISLLLALVMCISMVPAFSLASATGVTWMNNTSASLDGTGTESDPYQIKNGADLAKLISGGTGYAKLMNDIDLSAYTWVGMQFSGTLDGNGRMISGLTIGSATERYSPASAYVGLISKLTGTVKNLAVEMSIFTNGSGDPVYVGGIAAQSTGTIDNCTVTGTIEVHHDLKLYVGGIAGQMAGGSIVNCVNRANVTGYDVSASGKNTRIGGIAGDIGSAAVSISNCVNFGNITLAQSKRGKGNCIAAGICVDNSGKATINNCYNAGVISYDETNAPNGTAEQIVFMKYPDNTVLANTYYLSGDKFVKFKDTDITFSDSAAMLEELNVNAAVGQWLEWELGNDGYPVPGKDLLPVRLTGSLVINGAAKYGQTLTAVLSGCNEENVTYQWRRSTDDGFENIANANSTAYAVAIEDIGHILQVVVSAEGYSNVLAVNTAVVRKQDGPAAPDVTGVDATGATTNDGKLVGTTTAMEYSNFADFSTVFDCADSETIGLAPGAYYVRVKATELVEAGAYKLIVIRDATAPEMGYWTDDGNYTSDALSGSGTESDPYLITNAADLAKLAKEFNNVEASAGKYFKITASEIDLSGHEWVPITSFAGVLDGGNVNIRGMWIGTELFGRDYRNVGLFGILKAGSVAKNLNVNGTIYINRTKDVNAGMIAGEISGTIDHCVVSGKIHVVSGGNAAVGGIAGRVTVDTSDVRLANLGSSVDVYSMGAADNSTGGGIVGWVQHRPTETTDMKVVYILNCFNTGKVSAGVEKDGSGNRARAGGIVGWLRGLTEDVVSVTLQNCYNIGEPIVHSVGGSAKGTLDGIVGTAQSAFKHFKNCYSWSGIAKASEFAGVDGKISGDQMSIAELQSSDFAVRLTINANALVAAGYSDLYAWTVTPNGTPVFADNKVTGNAVTVSASVNSARLGAVKVEVSAGGTEAYTTVGSFALVEKGDKVRVTFLPTAGCAVQSATANDVSVVVEENAYTFTVEEDTVINGLFAVVSTVDTDPIYVDADAAPGGDGSEGRPYATLQEALEKIKLLVAEMPNANVTVNLMGGTYVLDETIRLDAAVSSLGRVTFKNYNDDKPVISSAHTINGTWTKVEGKNYYSYQLSGTADSYPAFRDLLVNGTRAQLAKSKEYTYQFNWVNAVMNGSKIASCDNLLYISAEALAGITNENLDGIEIGQLMEWKSQIFHIAELTGESKVDELQIKLAQDEFYMLVNTDSTMKELTGRTYWLQNHINFLDEPGEFYYDKSTGTIYYYPLSDVDMATAEIGYATLDYLVELENAANITFDGITFTGTTANDITEHGLVTHLGNTLRDPSMGAGKDAGKNVPYAAIHGISNVEGVTVQNCVFTELGGSAMVFDLGIKDLTVVGNVMKNLAMSGIQVGKNQRNWGENNELGGSENVAINNNYVTNIGLVVYGAPGIRVARCVNLQIQHNTVIHVPYSGIMAGYGYFTITDSSTEAAVKNLVNADISYNYIEDFLYKINDGGAIYTSGGNAVLSESELFNEIHHNYVRAGAHNKTYTGIYHDGSASNWYTHHNVIDDVKSAKGPMFFQDDVEAQNTHNIKAAYNYTSVSAVATTAKADRNVVLLDNVMVDDRAALLAIPEAKAIMEAAGLEEAYADIADPMDVAVQIQDSTMHYGIQDTQQENTVVHVQVTNNYSTNKRFTLSIMGNLPSIVSYVIDGNGVELAPGQSAVMTITFTADMENFYTTDDVVCGFVITEDNGKVTEFARQFTFNTRKTQGNNIAYGTPTVDGYLDDAYRNSVHITLSSAVTDGDYKDPTTNTSGSAYLLWDEQYLYIYVIVHDTTLRTRGIDYITQKYNEGKGNPNDLWRTDAVESYVYSYLRGAETKFGIDAFGIQPFTNSNVGFEVVDALPYATKFTYEGEILDDYVVENPAAGQYAGTKDRIVNGYVVEMTIPMMTCMDLATPGKAQIGDVIRFFIQLNDYTTEYIDDYGAEQPNVLGLRNAVEYFTLMGEHTCEDADKDHKCDSGCNAEFGVCEDADKDHACDYGCGKAFGKCKDADGDGLCDYGCGKTFEDPNASVPSGVELPWFTRIINLIIDFFNKLLTWLGLAG